MEIEEKIKSLIKEKIEKLGYELGKIKVRGGKRKAEVIVVIKKEKGISIKDCERVSKLIDPILEKENLFDGPWYLIVSSAGLDEEELDQLNLKE